MDILDILVIVVIIYNIIIFIKAGIDIKHSYTRDKQIAKNLEMMRYHFWLTQVGLEETALMFNEFGISVSLGEEV